MEIISVSCTFGKVPKTIPKLFFDMLKKQIIGFEKSSKNNKYKVVKS